MWDVTLTKVPYPYGKIDLPPSRPLSLGCHPARTDGVRAGNGAARCDGYAVPLDDLHLGIKGPLVIKIDTQGAEPFVFSGGKETLSKADLIVVEWSPYHMARLGGESQSPLRTINSGFILSVTSP